MKNDMKNISLIKDIIDADIFEDDLNISSFNIMYELYIKFINDLIQLLDDNDYYKKYQENKFKYRETLRLYIPILTRKEQEKITKSINAKAAAAAADAKAVAEATAIKIKAPAPGPRPQPPPPPKKAAGPKAEPEAKSALPSAALSSAAPTKA
jgi:hypothetical protein